MTKPGGVDMREELNMMASGSLLDDEDTYKDCEALALTSGSGADAIHFRLTASVLSDVASGAREASSVLRATPGTQPLSPAQISNQATLAARAAISAYYAAPARSDDEVAPHDSRDVCLRVLPGSSSSAIGCAPFDPDSAATMLRTVTEADLYTQLTAFHRALDIEGAARRARGDDKEVEAAGLRLSPLRQALEGAAAAVERFRSSCGYKWVDLAKLYSGNSSSLADEAAASIAEPAAA